MDSARATTAASEGKQRGAAKATPKRVLRSAAPVAIPATLRAAIPPGGAPLPVDLRSDMEARLGQDFSNVLVHNTPVAAALAERRNANAYTVGEHIIFAQHRFAPSRPDGRRLIAHELAHVVQQRRGGGPPSGVAQSTLEAHAERAAEAAAPGTASVTVAGASGVAIMCDGSGRKKKRAWDDEEEFGEDTQAADQRAAERRRTQERKAGRAVAGKDDSQIIAENAERELRALEDEYNQPGAQSRSDKQKLRDLKRYQGLLDDLPADTPEQRLKNSQRQGAFDELQRTPTRTAGKPQDQYVAGGPRLPFMELRPGTDHYAQPDYSVYRRKQDGTFERVHVNLKSDRLARMSKSDAVARARQYADQALRNSWHLPDTNEKGASGQSVSEGIYIRFAHTPSPDIQEAMLAELFREGSPIKAVAFGQTVYHAEHYRGPRAPARLGPPNRKQMQRQRDKERRRKEREKEKEKRRKDREKEKEKKRKEREKERERKRKERERERERKRKEREREREKQRNEREKAGGRKGGGKKGAPKTGGAEKGGRKRAATTTSKRKGAAAPDAASGATVTPKRGGKKAKQAVASPAVTTPASTKSRGGAKSRKQAADASVVAETQTPVAEEAAKKTPSRKRAAKKPDSAKLETVEAGEQVKDVAPTATRKSARKKAPATNVAPTAPVQDAEAVQAAESKRVVEKKAPVKKASAVKGAQAAQQKVTAPAQKVETPQKKVEAQKKSTAPPTKQSAAPRKQTVVPSKVTPPTVPTPKKQALAPQPVKPPPIKKPTVQAPTAPPTGMKPVATSGVQKRTPPPSGQRGLSKQSTASAQSQSHFGDQVRITVQEITGDIDKPYLVTTRITVHGSGMLGGSSGGSTQGGAHVVASGMHSIAYSTRMSEAEKNEYLKNISGGRGGPQPALSIVELIANGKADEAAALIEKSNKTLGAADAFAQRTEGDMVEVTTEGDVALGASAGKSARGGASVGGQFQIESGEGRSVFSTKMGDKELITVVLRDRSGRTLGGSLGYGVAGMGYTDRREESGERHVSFLLDPKASDYQARRDEIIAAQTLEGLNAIAARQPQLAYGRGQQQDKSQVGSVEATVLGFGLAIDQGGFYSEGVSEDPEGRVRTVSGGGVLGGGFVAGGRRISPESRTDSFTGWTRDDNTGEGVTQSEHRQVDYARSAERLVESAKANPVATVVEIARGNKPVVQERVDAAGAMLVDDSFARIAEVAKDKSAWDRAWDMRGVSRGAYEEWEATRQKVLAANGDRYKIQQALAEWQKGDSGRSGDVERLAGETGVAFEFPDELADQRPVYESLIVHNPLARPQQLLAQGDAAQAVKELEWIDVRLGRLLQAIQTHEQAIDSPKKFAEMQQRITKRREEVRAALIKTKPMVRAHGPQPGDPDFVGPYLPEHVEQAQADQEKEKVAAERKMASDQIHDLVGVCLVNRDKENRTFVAIEDELDDFYVNLRFVFDQINSLKPMYETWDGQIEKLKGLYPKIGDSPDRADQFKPNRTKWKQLYDQSLK